MPSGEQSVTLAYPRRWESRLYITGVRQDLEIWRRLPELKLPLLVIRGGDTDTFWRSTARALQRVRPATRVITIPNATHLVPLEKTHAVAQAMSEFLEPFLEPEV